MSDGLEDNEVEDIINSIPNLVNLFEMDILRLAEHYKSNPLPDSIQVVVHAKNNFQKELQHSRRVKESDLEDLNLGMADDPKIVKIGTWLPREFKEKLTAILQEYKDVFAWS